MLQGYIPANAHDNQQHSQKKKKKLPYIIISALVISLIVSGLVLLLNVFNNGSNVPGSPNYLTTLDASGFFFTFSACGLPVANLIEYNEETDPNKLLGRPSSYISKANFADTRIDQYDLSDPLGGTIEVFSNTKDAKSRYDYCMAFSGTIFGDYCFLWGNVLLRISYDLTPEQAIEYETAMKLAMGVIPEKDK